MARAVAAFQILRAHRAEKAHVFKGALIGSLSFGNIKEVHAAFGKSGVNQIAHAAQKKQGRDKIDDRIFLLGHETLCEAERTRPSYMAFMP
mgnify:CR=1 FL=1